MLLEKLSRDLVAQTPAVERVNVISSALKAAGQLHWRNTGLSTGLGCLRLAGGQPESRACGLADWRGVERLFVLGFQFLR